MQTKRARRRSRELSLQSCALDLQRVKFALEARRPQAICDGVDGADARTRSTWRQRARALRVRWLVLIQLMVGGGHELFHSDRRRFNAAQYRRSRFSGESEPAFSKIR